MNWLSVILFAIITGVYTGAIMLFPVLENTSFQHIGISYEWWVIFAVIVVVNCNKNWDAMLKCFVFFLISQPLVYIVEVVFGSLAFSQGLYYYTRIWLPATFLTIPGGFIAYYCKKQNLIGSVILGIGNTIQCLLGLFYAEKAISTFPYHLLSAVICFVSMFIMSFYIQKEKKYRLISIIFPFVASAIIIAAVELSGLTFFGA